MKSLFRFLLLSLCVVVTARAETPSSDTVMNDAKAMAAAEQKAIYLHFGASWCPWCKRMDAFLARPDIKPIFDKYFLTVRLVVQERGANTNLDNPGADALMVKLEGAKAGLPFFAFLDPQGSLLVNSLRSVAGNPNIGYPSEPVEIDWFVAMLHKGAPKMSDAEVKTIEAALRAASAKPGTDAQTEALRYHIQTWAQVPSSGIQLITNRPIVVPRQGVFPGPDPKVVDH